MPQELRTIFMAADFEAEILLKKHAYVRVVSSPFEVWQNDVSRLVISGIGLAPAAAAFSWACCKFDFAEALNIGTAGASSAVKCVFEEYDDTAAFDIVRGADAQKAGEVVFASAYEISSVSSIEPYNDRVFDIAPAGRTLATSSRPVSSAKRRDIAGAKGELVDMEGYAFALAAEAFGKKISLVKLVSDFSEDCDIHQNIVALQRRISNVRGVFD